MKWRTGGSCQMYYSSLSLSRNEMRIREEGKWAIDHKRLVKWYPRTEPKTPEDIITASDLILGYSAQCVYGPENQINEPKQTERSKELQGCRWGAMSHHLYHHSHLIVFGRGITCVISWGNLNGGLIWNRYTVSHTLEGQKGPSICNFCSVNETKHLQT